MCHRVDLQEADAKLELGMKRFDGENSCEKKREASSTGHEEPSDCEADFQQRAQEQGPSGRGR